MRGFAGALPLLGLSLVGSAAFATAQRIEPIHPERESMSASARREALLDDLDTLLVGPATPTGIATAPLAVGTDLCRRDVIALRYRRTQEGASKGPFRPVEIEAVSHGYHLIGYSNELSESQAQKTCQSLDKVKDYWASSNSESTARFGLVTLKEVAAAVRKTQGVTLDCKALQNAVIEARCASEFLAVADHPLTVNECPDQSRVAGRDCYNYDLGDYWVTITRAWSTSGDPTATVKLELPDIIV